MLAIMGVSFLAFLLLGMPMAFAMGLSAVLALFVQGEVPLILLPQRFFSSLDSFPLLAVPLYIFAGELMNVGGITRAMVDFSRALVGHVRGGLAQVNILTSVLFAGISGSAAADTSAVGAMLIPAMTGEGYKKEYSVAVTATSSIIGPIIPPSILMVLYGSMTGLSIGSLFLAGIVPGLLTAGGLMLVTYYLADTMGGRRMPRSSWREVASTFRRTLPALLMPAIIIVGILSGMFTATEAGAIAVAYGALFGFISSSMDVRKFLQITLRAARATGSVLIILGGASLFSWVLAREGFPQMMVEFVTGLSASPTVSLLLIMGFLLILGLFVETIAGLILVVPVLTPIATNLGFDPIHFAIVTIVTLLIGAVTPPVAILVLIACRIAGIEYSRTFRALLPFIGVLISVALLLAFVPQATLLLPRLLMP